MRRLTSASAPSQVREGRDPNRRFEEYNTANPAINPAVVLDLSDNHLSNAPEWTGHLGAEYPWPAFGGEISIRGEVFASSRVYFSPFNDFANSQEAYTLENVTLRFDANENSWFIALFGKNLRD